MSPDTLGLARQTLDIVPLVMRTLVAEVRRGGSSLAPSHFRLLSMLTHCPCNLSEMARRQGVSLPTMSDSITVLVDRGLARRAPSAQDRRIVNVELTESGRRAWGEMQTLMEQHVAELLAGLSPEQQASLAAGLDVLRQVIQSAGPPEVCKDRLHLA